MNDEHLDQLENILDQIEKEYDFIYETMSKKAKYTHEEPKDKENYHTNTCTNVASVRPSNGENVDALQAKIQKLKDELTKLREENAILKTANQEHIYKLQMYKNEIMDLNGSVRVLVRINKSDQTSSIQYTTTSVSVNNKTKIYKCEYDKVFDIDATQSEVFMEVKDVVESIFVGYKVCMFAYGQTGSGKTYTMIGNKNDPGVMYRFFDLLYSTKRALESDGYEVVARCNYLEIYNDAVNHLSATDDAAFEYVTLEDFDNAIQCFEKACDKRMTGSTECNSQSSRSHFICDIQICISNGNETRNGSLCFVDLAGSERLSQSHATGVRMKETQFINKSLSSLGDVFMAILTKNKHIPYRNSKLTYFLSKYLEGNSRVVMILNISGSENNTNETINTLRFGEKISHCKLGKVQQDISKKL